MLKKWRMALAGRGLDESGQGLAEYLILVLLVAVVSIAAARTLGGTVKKKIQLAERHLQKVQIE